MTLLWLGIRPPRDIEAARATMEALGFIFRAPHGVTRYWVDQESGQLVKDVGSITVGCKLGRVNIYPHVDGDDRDLAALMGMAELAFHTRPTKATNWKLCRSGKRAWWDSNVVVAARPESRADARVLSVVACLPGDVQAYLDGELRIPALEPPARR